MDRLTCQRVLYCNCICACINGTDTVHVNNGVVFTRILLPSYQDFSVMARVFRYTLSDYVKPRSADVRTFVRRPILRDTTSAFISKCNLLW